MRWYVKESEQPKEAVSEEKEEVSSVVEPITDVQEAYERGFQAGFRAAQKLDESSSEEIDLEEGLVQDAIAAIKNVDFYGPFKNIAKKSLKAICKLSKGKTADDIVADIKNSPVDSLAPVYSNILASATKKESSAMDIMKKNGFNKALMAIIINFCRETGAFLPDYARLDRNSARKIMDHFERTASKFWDDFFKDKKNLKALEMAVA